QYAIDVSVSGEGGTASAKTSAVAEEWIDITCDADTGYAVDKITVNGSAITGTRFPMPAKPANVVVTFKKAVYKIALIKPVGGTAKIAKTTAYYGESIAVTTQANTGYELDKIYVNGSPVSSKTSFTMPASDAEVEVFYKLIDYDIEVECGPNGTASVSKDPANYGDRIVITATPNSRYTIETIKVNGKELVGTMEFTMGNAPATVEVTFKRADYTISSSVSGGNGKISVVKMANAGDSVAVECTPNAGYTLDKILVNGNAITGTSFTMSAQDTTVVVSFKLAVYSISINKPAGGTAKLSQTSANYGDLVTVTATPSTGYRLKSITVNGMDIEIDRFSMPDKNTNVVVTFEKFEYEITLNQPANGTVSVNKNPANYGDKITVTAKPSEGYTLDTIKVNGKALSSGVYTFTMGNAPAEVEVTFKKIQYSITVSYSAGGTATSDPRKAGINDLVSVICKPNNGYEVASITVNGESGEESFLMPAKNTKVYVTFKKTDYRITLACGPNGEAGVTKDTANIGDKITVNTYPNPGYVLDFIKVNNNQITGSTFTMGAGNTTVEVHFKLKDLKVKVTALPGGTAKADVTTAKMGETVTLTVTPDEGYKLSYIMVNNKKASMAFEMGAEDAEVTVAFEKIPYNISKSVGPNGNASIDSTVAVIGELITVNVTPDENYYAIIKVNGEDIGGNTFVMPASNVSVTVTFERVSQLSAGESGKVGNTTYTVTGVAPENGTGTVRLDKIEDNGTAAVVVPDTVSIKGYTYRVTSIASYALANNPSMTSLKIGAYVTSVGNYVASGCRNLTKVYGGNRLKTIGTRAFNGCSRLKSFSIYSAVLSKIGAYSFNGDRSLKTIYVNKTTKLSKKGVKKSLKGSKVKTVKVKKSKVRKYKKYFTKKNCGRKVKVKK
nr:leucine-rich repeat protein [Saccharofermentans sp.]